MGETRHTPGPWSLDYDTLAGGHILVCTSDYGIAKVYDEEPGSRGMNMANARLIAAAPDLLAALQGLVDAPQARLNLAETWAPALAAIRLAAPTPATASL